MLHRLRMAPRPSCRSSAIRESTEKDENLPKSKDADVVCLEPRQWTYQLCGRLGQGERHKIGDPDDAQEVNKWLALFMEDRKPGETFWVERVVGEEVYTGYDGRGPQAPVAKNVCAGRRSTMAAKVETQRLRYPRSLIDGFLCTTCRDLVRWTSPVLIITLFGILVILLAGNFLGQ